MAEAQYIKECRHDQDAEVKTEHQNWEEQWI